jgi:hypothetical protein
LRPDEQVCSKDDTGLLFTPVFENGRRRKRAFFVLRRKVARGEKALLYSGWRLVVGG